MTIDTTESGALTVVPGSPAWQVAVDRLYDAVGREQQLAQALGEIRHFFRAEAVSFITAPDSRHPNSSHTGAMGLTDQMLVEYHAHYSVHDAWVQAALRRPDFGPGAVYRGSELVDPAELRRSHFGRAFLARHGVTDVLATVVEAASAGGPLSFVSFYRRAGSPHFSTADARGLSALATHLRQVFRLHRRLAPELAIGATLQELMQRLPTPLLHIAADGGVVHTNQAAALAVAAQPPGWLQLLGGRLHVTVNAQWQPVAQWLPALTEQAGRNLQLALLDAGRRSASLDIYPVPGAVGPGLAQHAAVALCHLQAGPRDRERALVQVYGLTATEARVARLLAEGSTPAAMADTMQVRLSTVRTHLAALRVKLGVRKQTQIVALVLGL